MEASSSRLCPTYFSIRKLLLGALIILSVIIASCLSASVSGSGGGVSTKVQLKDHRNREEDGTEIEASNVVQITNENYAKTIKQGTWFVKFYTDTCHFCRQLQPTWEELATDLKDEVMVGQVNCQTDMALCRRFQVRAYPTLVHIRNRKCRVYKADRPKDVAHICMCTWGCLKSVAVKGKSRSKADLAQFAVKGYKVTPAISALKSPFGPIENFKAYLVRGIHFVHKFVMEQVESGTPKWVLFFMSVGAVVVITIIFALVIVLSYPDKPKRD